MKIWDKEDKTKDKESLEKTPVDNDDDDFEEDQEFEKGL